MKKIISVVIAIAVCLSLVGVVMAAESGAFTPSVTYKDQPDNVTVDAEGASVPALFVDAEGKILSAAGHDCVEIVAVAEAEEESDLRKVYTALSDGSMTLPRTDVVVRELLDISVVCEEEHAAALKNGEALLTIVFDLGVAAEDEVCVYSYVDETWVEAAEVINNGDGTVTITFARLCPVAIAVKAA